MKVVIASDHAGFDLKEIIKKKIDFVSSWQDFGTFSFDNVDYPDFAHPLAKHISENSHEKGILICGTGNGVAMTANKHENVRAAICWNETIAALARQHNDANILVLPARFVTEDVALKIVTLFFFTSFEAGRHEKRVNKINII